MNKTDPLSETTVSAPEPNIWQETYATDEVLSRIISVLRNRLGDDSKSPTYIETLPKVGYRLLLPVSTLPDNASSDLDVISTRRRNFWRSEMVAMAVKSWRSRQLQHIIGPIAQWCGQDGFHLGNVG